MISKKNITFIRAGAPGLHLRDLLSYRELFFFLVLRDIKVRYKQTILGGLWAIIQPAFAMVVFSLFFGRMAGIPSDGIPYPLFVYSGLLAWMYFANALSASGESLVLSSNLITKIYFPRLIVPAAAAFAGLLDFFVAFSLLAVMMVYYGFYPGPSMLLFPVLVVLTFLCAAGCGIWLAALNVEYRDIRYAIPFIVQLWMFVSPVIYPSSLVPLKYQSLMALNPMAGIIKAFRSCLLGVPELDWVSLGISSLMIAFILAAGTYYFKRVERSFADVI